MKTLSTLAPLAPVLMLIALLAVFVSACSTTPTPPTTVYKNVPVPYPAPCPKPGDKPAVPKHVAEEHPTMPATAAGTTDWQAVSRILGDKVLEMFIYAHKADGVMEACSRP